MTHWTHPDLLAHQKAQMADAGYTDIHMNLMEESGNVLVQGVGPDGLTRQVKLSRAQDLAELMSRLSRPGAVVG